MLSDNLKKKIYDDATSIIAINKKRKMNAMDKLVAEPDIIDLANKLHDEIPKTNAWKQFNVLLMKYNLLPKRNNGKVIRVSYPRFLKMVNPESGQK